MNGFTFICRECGIVLTEDEKHYYEDRCEECEREDFERIEAWRRGGHDPELDALFGSPSETTH